jgi:hypothetical protein
MALAPFPVNIQHAISFDYVGSNIGAKKKPRKNVALSSNREASNRVEKCHSENPKDWIAVCISKRNTLPNG